jgi:hypothetical protein
LRAGSQFLQFYVGYLLVHFGDPFCEFAEAMIVRYLLLDQIHLARMDAARHCPAADRLCQQELRMTGMVRLCTAAVLLAATAGVLDERAAAQAPDTSQLLQQPHPFRFELIIRIAHTSPPHLPASSLSDCGWTSRLSS